MIRPLAVPAAFSIVLSLGSWSAWSLGRRTGFSAPTQHGAGLQRALTALPSDGGKTPLSQPRSVLATLAGSDMKPLTDAEFSVALTEAGKLIALAHDGPGDLSGFRILAQFAVLVTRATPEQRKSLDALLRGGDTDAPGIEMVDMLSAGLRRPAPTDAEAVKRELSDRKLNADAALMKVMALAADDPEAACNLMLGELGREKPAAWAKPWFLSTAFGLAAGKDYVKAMETAMKIGPAALRAEAMTGAASGLAQFYGKTPTQAPVGRDELLKAYLTAPGAGETEDRTSAVVSVIRARLTWEPMDRTLSWVESLGLAPSVRTTMDRAIYDLWAVKEPGPAAEWMLSRKEPSERPEVVLTAIRRWTRAPRAQGLLFADTFPTLPSADAVAAAADWLIARGTGPDNATAVQTLAEAYLRIGEPQAALRWAHAIAEPAVKEVALHNITRHIQRRYPDTAAELLSRQATLE